MARRIALVALTLATAAIAACSSPTAPTNTSKDCGTVNGSSICK
jgi:hypothetical protein